ncbi:MAG TPA: ATP-dependent DNA ligase, partial [Bryobacteraceae bacterium]
MLLAKVVETSRRITETSKRLEKTALLAGLLKELNPEEVETVAGFLAGAPRQGRIGIGYAALHSSMAAAGADASTIEILEVDRVLDEISTVRGAGSEQRKRDLLGSLFLRATSEEQHFLVRLLSGELRQGALEGILLDALAKASGISSERIRRAAMMAGGAAAIARAALEKGESGLSPFDIQLFRPVQPMLAQTAEDLGAALADLGEASLEYKLDGARIQVHKAGDQVAIFSRGANDVTAAVPEVVQLVRALPAHD